MRYIICKSSILTNIYGDALVSIYRPVIYFQSPIENDEKLGMKVKPDFTEGRVLYSTKKRKPEIMETAKKFHKAV